jgi:hypothetical protein
MKKSINISLIAIGLLMISLLGYYFYWSQNDVAQYTPIVKDGIDIDIDFSKSFEKNVYIVLIEEDSIELFSRFLNREPIEIKGELDESRVEILYRYKYGVWNKVVINSESDSLRVEKHYLGGIPIPVSISPVQVNISKNMYKKGQVVSEAEVEEVNIQDNQLHLLTKVESIEDIIPIDED